MFSFLKRKKTEPEPEPFKAVLDGQSIEGELDIHSATWIFVETWANKEIERIRCKNDSLNHDDKATAALRGEIRVLKRLMGLKDK